MYSMIFILLLALEALSAHNLMSAVLCMYSMRNINLIDFGASNVDTLHRVFDSQ